RVAGEADPAGDLDPLRLGLDAEELDALLRGKGGDAIEALEEVEVPPRAAELAIGGALQADLLLLADDGLDLAVIDRLELIGGNLARRALRARLLQRGRAQQAADMIGAERRRGAWHGVSSGTTSCPRKRASSTH